jgi:hypothetical protein
MIKKLMRVFPIPLFEDNYSYLILGIDQKIGFLVDPADSKTVF